MVFCIFEVGHRIIMRFAQLPNSITVILIFYIQSVIVNTIAVNIRT